jgi:16S rRNA processing protein RimM
LWVHELIGSRVVDQEGIERGTCIAVIDNPAHDILELDTGALIPVIFVISCRDRVATIDPPDGLFDL